MTTATPSTTAPALSRLYAARFGFALVWAALAIFSVDLVSAERRRRRVTAGPADRVVGERSDDEK